MRNISIRSVGTICGDDQQFSQYVPTGRDAEYRTIISTDKTSPLDVIICRKIRRCVVAMLNDYGYLEFASSRRYDVLNSVD